MRGIFTKFFCLVVFLFFCVLTACGGGSPTASIPLPGPSNIQALQISDQVSIVTAQDDLGSSQNISFANLIAFAVPTTGAYITDEPESYVHGGESMQPLDLINEIVCSINQTRYETLVNTDPYLALIDNDSCQRSADQSTESSNQTSGRQKDLEKWIIQSIREDENSDHLVFAWIYPNTESGDEGENRGPEWDEIRAILEISESASSTNPFGVFTMNFQGLASDGTVQMEGALSSTNMSGDQVELQLSIQDEASSNSLSEQVHAIINPATESGTAYTFQSFNPGGEGDGGGNKTSLVSFDSTHYLAQITDNADGDSFTECLDRDSFDSTVWEYNLYDSNGALVDQTSGLSIQYDDNTWGWADYYGIWLDDQSLSLDGLTVTSDDASYTVLEGKGRLMKRVKESITLGELIGDTFSWWDDSTQRNYKVKWNGSSFVKTAIETCSETGCTTQTVSEESITLTANQWFGLWKDGFGSIDLVVPQEGLSNSTTVPHFVETAVTPDDLSSDLTLYCYQQCLKGSLSASDLNSNTPYFTDLFNSGDSPYVYTFSPTSYSLTHGGQSITIATGSAIDESSFYSWGVRSGAMVTTPLQNPWEAWEQDLSYYWETGPESWNRYATLLDGNGNTVSFDPPIRCEYTDETHGTFFLDYNGPGQLWGIPYEEADSSGNSDFERWVAKFSIPNGSELDCEGTSYYSKAMVVEQFMQSVDSSSCSDLSVPTISAPTIEFNSSYPLNAVPTIADEARVVSGEVVE